MKSRPAWRAMPTTTPNSNGSAVRVELARYVLASQWTTVRFTQPNLGGGPGSAMNNGPLMGISLTDVELGEGASRSASRTSNAD